MDTDTLIRLGWQSLLGKNADVATLDGLCRSAKPIRFQAGDNMSSRGDVGMSVSLIVSGKASLMRQTRSGHEVWLADLGVGDLVGIVPALSGTSYPNWVVASSPVLAASLPGATFLELALGDGRLALAALQHLSLRYSETVERLAQLFTLNVAARLHVQLFRLGRPADLPASPRTLNVLPGATELAKRIHATRESTSRALSDLKRRQLLVQEAETWLVQRPRVMGEDPDER